MQTIRQAWAKEPAVIIGAIIALVSSLLALVTAFGLDLTQEQTGAAMAFVGAVLALVQGLTTRQQVYAPATVDELQANARAASDEVL